MHIREVATMLFFARTHAELENTYHSDFYDKDAIEKDLTEFFEHMNIYAEGKRKITQLLKKSGLDFTEIRHEDHGAWNPIVTVLKYRIGPESVQTNEFRYTWR